MLKNKKILLGVTGSIAAFKIPALIRLFIKEGAEVQVILTPFAKNFITPLTVYTLSGKPVLTDFFSDNNGQWYSHVEMGNWADLMLIAPASANTLAKMATGIADNLLLATYLAAKCPVYFAPAMDMDMYKHPATQKNIKTLIEYGNKIIPPREGELASGLCGAGRMEEPEEIIKFLINEFKKKNNLKGKKALVTAGPTYEPIDPVRFIGNHSSGIMGVEIARELMNRGAEVNLICGPIHYPIPNEIKCIKVTTAEQMLFECLNVFPNMDILVMAAAVADYKPSTFQNEKIKKSNKTITINLIPTPDILSQLSNIKKPSQFIVGFALETQNQIENAKNKLKNKNLDLVVLNSPGPNQGFASIYNKVTFINKNNKIIELPLKLKHNIASDIADIISDYFINKS